MPRPFGRAIRLGTFQSKPRLASPTQFRLAFRGHDPLRHHPRLAFGSSVATEVRGQCASVKHMSCELLRSGDKAIVTFRWCYHAEYISS